ncbi:MAG: hypothetical protein WDO73_13295 [Ignavibacteriota bacterium]
MADKTMATEEGHRLSTQAKTLLTGYYPEVNEIMRLAVADDDKGGNETVGRGAGNRRQARRYPQCLAEAKKSWEPKRTKIAPWHMPAAGPCC